MTNTELIAGARGFLATPNLGKDMARELDKALLYLRELADIAEAAEARVKGFEANFPCDGGCNYASGPEESCSLHGRNPADLWGIIANISAECYEAEARIAELEAGEWEYGLGNRKSPQVGGSPHPEARARWLVSELEVAPNFEPQLVRRRKAGPWLPVEGENK